MKAQSTPIEGQCLCCRQQNILVLLPCSHSFCVKCLTFLYHKHKLNVNRVCQTRCSLCDRVVELGQNQLKMINQFTDQVLVPLMREQQQRKNVKLGHTQPSVPSKQFKSHEQSIQKLTPLNRGFYSKCQSPKIATQMQTSCMYHPDQELNVVCLSCQNAVLCLSCTAGKKHTSHTVKTLNKGLEAIFQQIALTKLKCRENVGVLQVLRRRVEDKRSIVQDRWEKAKMTLKLHFDNLQDLLTRKREELVQTYSQIFQKQKAELMRDQNRVYECIKEVKKHSDKLNDLTKSNSTNNYIQTIRKSTAIIEDVRQFKQPELQYPDMPGGFDYVSVVRQLDHICQKVEKIAPQLGYEMLGGTITIKNSKSQEKLLKQTQCKRAKTNMISLNSSRQKKEKKYTKTEEDERRNKSRANYKTQSNKISKINKNYPAYLLQCLQKNNNAIDSFAQNNPLTSSFKSTKLLSKSHLPGEDVKRKKEHVALIKERLERKTFNGTTKEHRHNTEGVRKKKIPY